MMSENPENIVSIAVDAVLNANDIGTGYCPRYPMLYEASVGDAI